MTARHYGQFLPASDPNQTDDDELIYASTPIEIRSGTFKIGFIQKEAAADGTVFIILSVDCQAGTLDFRVSIEADS